MLLLTNMHPATLEALDQLVNKNCESYLFSGRPFQLMVKMKKLDMSEEGQPC